MKPIHTKIAWLAFSLVGSFFVHFVAPGRHEWVHASAVLAVGATMFFFARETTDDERVEQLKLRAVKVAFIPAVALTLLLNMLVLNPREPDVVSRSLSAFDFASIVMLVASVLFYLWRWRDGRADSDQ